MKDPHENPMQPDSQTPNPEELDQLLDNFLAEDTDPDTPAPAVEENPEQTPETENAVPEEPATAPQDIWEDQEVDAPMVDQEIGPDEQAVAAVGLTHPEDLDFEKILEETKLEAQPADDAEIEDGAFQIPEDFLLADILTSIPEPTEQSEASEPADESQQEAPEQPTQEQTEEETQMEEQEEKPLKKRRPKKRDTYGLLGIPHILSTVIWLALVVFIGVGIGRMIWLVAADMLAFGRENYTVTITITAEDDLDDIAQKLHETGLINYPGVFKFYGRLVKLEQKVNPGTYELNAIYDYFALKNKMSTYAVRVTTTVTIPEGYTCAQIFQLLEKTGVCTVEDLQEAAMNADLSKYWFLEGIDRSSVNCLEGYLFPDTYIFYLDWDAEKVLGKLLRNFDARFSDAMLEQLEVLNTTLADMMRSHGLSESYIQKNLFTIQDLVTVASLIEKETSGDEESYYIASVIYNRLTNPGGETAGFLQIDATLVYINGGNAPTNADKEIDSPYNTYMHKGLPAGAISNPGLASLNAALSPEITEYYYYALNPSTGAHEFFKTYKAHQNFLNSLKGGG